MIRMAIALCFALMTTVPAAAKTLVADVDLSDQRLTVFYKGQAVAQWKVSTGRAGFRTPTGTFRPMRMHREYYSRQYDDAPMPNAIFYDRGYAIHGSYETRSLGRPASHGCVRLHPADAAKAVRAGGDGRPGEHRDPGAPIEGAAADPPIAAGATARHTRHVSTMAPGRGTRGVRSGAGCGRAGRPAGSRPA